MEEAKAEAVEEVLMILSPALMVRYKMKQAINKIGKGMKAITGNFSMSWKMLLQSFKRIDLNFLYILFFDALFYLSIGLASIFFYNLITNKLGELVKMIPLDQALSPNQLMVVGPYVKAMIYQVIALMICWLLIMLALWAVLKGFVWLFTLKKHFSMSYIITFVLFNLVWLGFWAIFTFFLSIIAKQAAFMMILIIVIIPLFLFYTPIMLTLFDTRIWISLREGLKFGRNIGKLISSYLFALIMFILLTIVLVLLRFIPSPFYMVLTGASLLVFLTWARIYLSTVVLSVSKKQKD